MTTVKLISDRSIRKYRQNLREGKSFTIALNRGAEGLSAILIYVDRSKNATMKNPSTDKFDLSLGSAEKLVELIAKGKTLPVPTPFFQVKDSTPAEVLKPVEDYEVDEEREEAEAQAERTAGAESSSKDKHDIRTIELTRTIPQARVIVDAYLEGKPKARKGWDVFNGTLWTLDIRRQVNAHWVTISTENVALFKKDAVTFKKESEYRAVTHRRVFLRTTLLVAGKVKEETEDAESITLVLG